MFDSDVLDRLSRVHPMVPPIVFGPVVIALFVIGAARLSTAETVGLLLAG